MKKQLLFLLAILFIIITCKAQNSQDNLLGTGINYQTGTIILTTINTALTTLNASGITPAWQSKYTQGLALVTGVGQLVYGIYQSGSSLSTLNIVNIGAGTATIITNALLLYNTLHSGGKKPTTWNIYISPVNKNNPQFGFQVVKYFKI